MVDDLIFEEQLYVMYYEGINIDLSLIENDVNDLLKEVV
jgi:hypothetical protein